MNIPVSRTCTEILPESPDPRREPVCGPLDTFRSAPAYVLLGDPGSGKSTAFCVEAEALGEDAVLMSTREFLRSYASPRQRLGGQDALHRTGWMKCGPVPAIRVR